MSSLTQWPRKAYFSLVCTPRSDARPVELMAKLKELGIAETTLLVCMADNGSMSHNPPPSVGMAETIFRGGTYEMLGRQDSAY